MLPLGKLGSRLGKMEKRGGGLQKWPLTKEGSKTVTEVAKNGIIFEGKIYCGKIREKLSRCHTFMLWVQTEQFLMGRKKVLQGPWWHYTLNIHHQFNYLFAKRHGHTEMTVSKPKFLWPFLDCYKKLLTQTALLEALSATCFRKLGISPADYRIPPPLSNLLFFHEAG